MTKDKLETGKIQSWDINIDGEVIKTFPSIDVAPTNKEIANKTNEIIDFLNERLK